MGCAEINNVALLWWFYVLDSNTVIFEKGIFSDPKPVLK